MPRPSTRPRAASASRAAAPPSADGYKTLRAAIDAGSYAPVYYLHGDDDYLKDASLQALLDAALDPSTRDFNCELRSGGEVDAETLGSLLATPPMLAARRAVVVRDAHLLKKAVRAELDRYLASPASDTLVVLLTPAGQATDVGLARQALACVFEPLPPERVRRWIAHHATTVLGVSVSTEAAVLLQQSVGNDLQALAAELDKCASYALGVVGRAEPGAAIDGAVALIDEAAVSAVVGVRRGETLVDLLDAILMRDIDRALPLVAYVLSQPKVTAVQVVMMLGTQLLALAWGRAKRDAGWSSGQLAREYMGYLKQSSGLVGRPWGEAISVWNRAVEQWSSVELRRGVRMLLEADISLKDTRVSNEEQVMQSLVLALARPTIAKPARGRAA
jgi:DNA polymerase III subunit delta